MRRRPAVLVLALVVLAALVAGCDADASPERPAPGPEPAVGGPPPRREAPPRRPMDQVERTVADRLARQVAAQGMRLAYVDCPPWAGEVPGGMTCEGYLDGVVTTVHVRLVAAPQRTVGFVARLGGGVVATRNLERTLHGHGWPDADCGEVSAYPAHVGDGIVCSVRRGTDHRYVVATVRSRAGAVRIDDYPGPDAAE